MNSRQNGKVQQVGDDVAAKKAKTDAAAKSGKPIVDIAKPGTTTPQTGAGKPVIVSNRPLIQDPMVVPQDSGGDKLTAPEVPQADAKKSHPSKSSLVLQPLTEAEKEPEKAPEPVEPAEPAEELKIELKPVGETEASAPAEPKTSKPAESDSSTKITVSGPEPEAETSTETGIEVKTIDSLPAEGQSDVAKEDDAKPTGKKPTKKGVDIKPLESKADEGEAEKSDTENPGPDASKPAEADKTAEETSADTSAPASGNADEVATAADAAKLEAEAKIKEDIDKLVESKQYFLPITTKEERRSRIRLIFGIIFAVLLVAAWVNVALDAGFIEFEGIKPLTDLF